MKLLLILTLLSCDFIDDVMGNNQYGERYDNVEVKEDKTKYLIFVITCRRNSEGNLETMFYTYKSYDPKLEFVYELYDQGSLKIKGYEEYRRYGNTRHFWTTKENYKKTKNETIKFNKDYYSEMFEHLNDIFEKEVASISGEFDMNKELL